MFYKKNVFILFIHFCRPTAASIPLPTMRYPDMNRAIPFLHISNPGTVIESEPFNGRASDTIKGESRPHPELDRLSFNHPIHRVYP